MMPEWLEGVKKTWCRIEPADDQGMRSAKAAIAVLVVEVERLWAGLTLIAEQHCSGHDVEGWTCAERGDEAKDCCAACCAQVVLQADRQGGLR